MTDDATSPVGGEDTADAILDAEAEVETQEIEQLFDDDGNPIEDDEEVDLDDLKLKVPKSQAQKVRDALMRQADYTRKTQGLADERKVFNTERQNLSQATLEELNVFAQASTLGQRVASYSQVDWNAWNQQAQGNPDEQARVNAAWMDYQQVKDHHQQAVGTLTNATQQRLSAEQQETARLMDEGRAVLAKDIGWNDELKAKLTDYAIIRTLHRDDLRDIEAYPGQAKILNDAYKWFEYEKQQNAAKRHETAQQVTPAAKVNAKGVPQSGVHDNLSVDEWMRRENARVRRRA